MTENSRFKEMALSYYEHIDKSNIDKALAFFSDDVHYKRCGKELSGINSLKKFYEKERSLRGRHVIDKMLVGSSSIAVHGKFIVDNGNEEKTAFSFSDFFEFNENGKINRRLTYTDQGKV